MKDKIDKATHRFVILYERGQNTKKGCMKYLSDLFGVDDEAYLRTVYQSVLNILEQRGEEWIEMSEEVANIDITDLPDFIKTIESLLEMYSLLDNSVVGKYLFPDVAQLETKLNTDLLLAKKRLWNVPTHEQPKKLEAVVSHPISLSFEWAKENKDKTALANFIYQFCPADDISIAAPFKGKRQAWLDSLESAINNTPPTQDKQSQARELREQGHNIQDIAASLEVSRNTITRWLK